MDIKTNKQTNKQTVIQDKERKVPRQGLLNRMPRLGCTSFKIMELRFYLYHLLYKLGELALSPSTVILHCKMGIILNTSFYIIELSEKCSE